VRVTRSNIRYHELIGLEVTVREHTDPSLKGVSGRVVAETKKTLIIKTESGEKVVPKWGGVFTFKLPRTLRAEVWGGDIIGRPEERLRRYGRR